MVHRREVLKLAFVALAGAVGVEARADGPAAAPTGFPLGPPTPFDPAMVTDMARSLAKQPYKALPADLPEAFKSLTYDQYVAIHLRPGATLWANDNIGFALEPLHRGFIFSTPMQINLVADGAARRLAYDAALFDFGKLSPPANLGDIGFSGFRILAPREQGGFFELATFQGASFFRAVGQGQEPGTMARALAIRTADPRGEEFPAIRSVWIERPTLAADTLVIYAIIDFRKRQRRLSLHAAAGRGDAHRHGMHAVRAGDARSLRHRRDERDASFRRDRQDEDRRPSA